MADKLEQAEQDCTLIESGGEHLFLERYPETEAEARLVEESLANAMAKLSVDEEDRILFDMYGFPSGIDDEALEPNSPGVENANDFTDSEQKNERDKLNQLEIALESRLRSVSERVRRTYERTIEMNKQFLHQQGLLFIAAVKEGEKDNFGDAAKLVLDHLELKSELFSESVLPRHVLWTDLTKKEQEVASYGCYQFAKANDEMGRMVFHTSSHKLWEILEGGEDEDWVRIFQRVGWYTFMSRVQSNLQNLDKGVVQSICSIQPRNIPFEITKACIRTYWRIPIRFQCLHLFHTNPTMHIRFKALQLLNIFFMGNKGLRISVHMCTSVSEIKDKMRSVGVDPAASPWADCKNDAQGWSNRNHLEWIGRQKHRERLVLSETQGSSLGLALVTPEIQPFDVLLGRSKKCTDHMGTKRCKVLVALKQEAYESSNAKGKTQIANNIVDAIGKSGGRFLRYENEQWTEVSLTIARQKVAHYFRFLRSKGRDD